MAAGRWAWPLSLPFLRSLWQLPQPQLEAWIPSGGTHTLVRDGDLTSRPDYCSARRGRSWPPRGSAALLGKRSDQHGLETRPAACTPRRSHYSPKSTLHLCKLGGGGGAQETPRSRSATKCFRFTFQGVTLGLG